MNGQRQRSIEVHEGDDNPVWVRGRWGARYYPASESPAELHARTRAVRPARRATPPPASAPTVSEAPVRRRPALDADTIKVDVFIDRAWDVPPSRPLPVAAPAPVLPRTSGKPMLRPRGSLVPAPLPEEEPADSFPAWLDSRDLLVRMTHAPERSTRHYEERVRSQPQCGAGWVGLAVIAISRGQVQHAAGLLARCRELEPAFPCGRVVREGFSGRPELWYDLARALVDMKGRAAYECADLLLEECVRSERTTLPLRNRAIRVRSDISMALDVRAHRDRTRGRRPSLLPAAVVGLVLAAVLVALGWFGLLPG